MRIFFAWVRDVKKMENGNLFEIFYFASMEVLLAMNAK